MIEIICNGEAKENGTSSKTIKTPKNIKQIGEIDSNKKIYIEDYVFTYINSVAYENPEIEKAGVLLGEEQKSSEESVIFIKGAIKLKLDEDKPEVIFSEKIWSAIYKDMERYFPDLQIVGWFVSNNTINNEYMQRLKKLHIDNFAGSLKTLYLVNTAEKDENFYLFERNQLNRQCGFVCFYERNNEMQEYMLANRGAKTVEAETDDTVIKNFRAVIQEKKEAAEQKKTMSLMYGVSTFMVVVVLVIGVNLMNSYEKMQNFDTTLNSVVKEIANMNVKSENYAGAPTLETQEDGSQVTPVTKLVGDVYPTESAAETTSNQDETKKELETLPDNAVVTASQAEAESKAEAEAKKAVKAKEEQDAVNAQVAKTYVVEKGDTLMSICKKTYGDVLKYKEVMKANDLDDPDKIYVGQEIKLP